MPTVSVAPMREDLPFGARISGVTHQALEDEANRNLIKRTFEERGVICFEDI
jgi:taurine dioxygenase